MFGCNLGAGELYAVLKQVQLRLLRVCEMHLSGGDPNPFTNLYAVAQVALQVVPRRGKFIHYCTDMTILGRVRLYRDDLATRPMAEQIVPSVLLLTTGLCRAIQVKAVGKLRAYRVIEQISVAGFDGTQSVHDCGKKLRGFDEGAPYGRFSGWCFASREFSSGSFHHESFTAARTASPKRDEYSVNPPQPEIRSSSALGSSVEISSDRTFD